MRRRLVGVAVAAAVTLGFLAAQAWDANLSSHLTVGISVEDEASGGIHIADVYDDFPAARAGIQAGDVLHEIGGVPVSRIADYDDAATTFRRGDPVVFRLERGGRSLELPVTPGSPFPWGQMVYATIAVLLYLTLGIAAWLAGGGDPRARLLFFFSLAVALELALPMSGLGRPALAALFVAGFYLLTGAQIGLLFHLAVHVPDRATWVDRHRWVLPAVYAGGLVLGLAAAAAWIGEALDVELVPWSSGTMDTLVYGVALPTWAAVVVAVLGHRTLRADHPRKRHQVGLVLAALVPWAIYIWITTAFDLFDLSYPDWIPFLESAVLLWYPIGVFLAISQAGLFDLELVVRRALVYTALTTTLVVLFYAVLGAAGAILSTVLETEHTVWAVAAATLILGLGFAPLRRSIERGIYARFFPERIAMRRRLSRLAEELPGLGDLSGMGRHVVEGLSTIFGARWATVLLADPRSGTLMSLATNLESIERDFEHSLLVPASDPGLTHLARMRRPLAASELARRSDVLGQRLEMLRTVVVAPLLSEDRLVGVLALGPTETGLRYQAEELELIDLLCHHVVTVFENARLFTSATMDGLTGLMRRETILETLDRETRRAERYGRPFSIAMIDVDNFKFVNDRFGHLTGDSLLKWVAHGIAEAIRSTDSVGRYGGEEFLAVYPETDLEGAEAISEKIRELVETRTLPTDGGGVLRVTVSAGIAALAPGESSTPEELLGSADRALYLAKEAGRNRVRSE